MVERLTPLWTFQEFIPEPDGEYVRHSDYAALEAELAAVKMEVERLDRDLQFVARWAWRTDPPNANNKLTDTERLSAIKYHPTVRKYAEPHIALAETEARRLVEGGGK